jgi:hypothetical protein
MDKRSETHAFPPPPTKTPCPERGKVFKPAGQHHGIRTLPGNRPVQSAAGGENARYEIPCALPARSVGVRLRGGKPCEQSRAWRRCDARRCLPEQFNTLHRRKRLALVQRVFTQATFGSGVMVEQFH